MEFDSLFPVSKPFLRQGQSKGFWLFLGNFLYFQSSGMPNSIRPAYCFFTDIVEDCPTFTISLLPAGSTPWTAQRDQKTLDSCLPEYEIYHSAGELLSCIPPQKLQVLASSPRHFQS